MSLDELQRLQSEADFLRQSARPLEEAFGRALPSIESALKEKVPLRLATGNVSRPGFAVQYGSLVLERHQCLSVYVPDTPAGAAIETLRSRFSPDPDSKQWLIWVEDTDEEGRGPSARTRKDLPALLLRISPGSRRPPRYLWWHSPSDNAKIVDAVSDTLSGVAGPSEFSFHSEVREAPKDYQLTRIFLWMAGIILPPMLLMELWGVIGREIGESLVVVYWFLLFGTIGWKIGRYKGFSPLGLLLGVLVCIIIPVWGVYMIASVPKRVAK